MKFKIHIETEDGRTWWEDYDKDVEDPDQWGKDTVDYFNKTLHPGEESRKYLGCEVIDINSLKDHNWSKRSLVTERAGYDIYQCDNCGITGKRRGFSETIKIDSKFKAKVYQRCDTAQAHLKKKNKK